MRQPEVYTLGRLIVDLYASEIGVPLAEVNTFRKYLGGSAANTAVGLARHGANVGLISRVGSDDFGVYLRSQLEKELVDTEMVKVDNRFPTGLAFAALFPPSDSNVLFYRKPCADANLSLQDINFEKLKNARMLVVACTALAVSPGREAALSALEANRASGGINVLDIDWRPIFWTSEEEAKLYYRAAVRLSDVVIANEPELKFAGGSANPAEASSNLLALGVKEVVAKRGAEGCLYFSPDENMQVSPFQVQVMNTLGAGDGFGAAYTFGMLQGWNVERRLEYASAAGAIVVSRHSCSEAMPTSQEVEDLLAAKSLKGGSQ